MATARNTHDLDTIIIRYADDITIASKHPGKLRTTTDNASRLLNNYGLPLNHSKTEVTQWNRGSRINYLGYAIEHCTTGITIAPKRAAYAKLQSKLESTPDPTRQLQTITGWLNAYALTNRPHEAARALDFIGSLQALRLHPHLLPAPAWGAALHDLPPVPRKSAFLDYLAARVAARSTSCA